MLWQVRALLPDRPGAMAALASRCGARGANILALDVHPAADDEVVDELVLHTPDGWTAQDVKQLCAEAGVFGSTVLECSAHALEDQPVRYLRAARTVVQDPGRLEELLCRMLDAKPVRADGTAVLLLDDDAGPLVALGRTHPFTAAEVARAAELRLVAAAALERAGAESGAEALAELLAAPPARGVGPLRRGTVVDIRPLVEMHDRCSAETLSRRYHSPMRRLSPRMARAMLLPADGFSLVLPDESGGGIVAMGMVAFQDDVVEVALLVEDRWQGQGHGTELLRALATEAVRMGAEELTLIARRDDTAVLATVHRAGFRAHVRCVDGVNRLRVPLGRASATRIGMTKKPGDRPVRRRMTEPLVALLHERKELREVYAPADIIDQAVRDGV